MMRDVPERANRGPALVVGAAIVTMAAGFLLKAPCLGSWADGRQYNLLCYSDVAALYGWSDRSYSRMRLIVLVHDRGDLDEPTKVTSWDQFKATFGAEPVPGFYLWYAARGFFENGGNVTRPRLTS
jgi:hypothetical protein